MKKLFAVLAIILAAATARAEDVTLMWDAPTEGAPTGYRIYQGAAPGDYSKTLDVGLMQEAIMQGLVSGKTYYWAATALYPEGESGYSNEVFKAIPGISMPVPLVSTVSDGVETRFFIDSGKAIPTRYLVRIAEDPVDPNINATSVLHESTSNPIIVKGLTQGKLYNFYGRYKINSLSSPKSIQSQISIPTVIILKAPMQLIIKVE